MKKLTVLSCTLTFLLMLNQIYCEIQKESEQSPEILKGNESLDTNLKEVPTEKKNSEVLEVMETDSGVVKTKEEADKEDQSVELQKSLEETDKQVESEVESLLKENDVTNNNKINQNSQKSEIQKKTEVKPKKKQKKKPKKKKKKKKKFRDDLDRYYEEPEPPLIIKLLDPSYIVEDVGDNLRVVLFVQNDKTVLKNKESGEGKARVDLIKSLKKQRSNPEMDDVNFYFTDCKFIAHLCEELNISKISNQVVYLTNYTITPIRMDYLDLQEELFNRLFNGLQAFKNIEYLNHFIETTKHSNVVLFNFDKPPTKKDLKAKKKKGALGRAMKIIRECRRNCFNYMNYVYLEEADDFLKQEEKKNKVTINIFFRFYIINDSIFMILK